MIAGKVGVGFRDEIGSSEIHDPRLNVKSSVPGVNPQDARGLGLSFTVKSKGPFACVNAFFDSQQLSDVGSCQQQRALRSHNQLQPPIEECIVEKRLLHCQSRYKMKDQPRQEW